MKPSNRRALIGLAVAVVLAILTWYVQGNESTSPTPDARAGSSASATVTGDDPESGLPWMSVEQLPAEGQQMLTLIDAGGPFARPRDGVTFENREELLPGEQRGYYHEYTVTTPGSGDRGARRIVTGDGGEFYYTDDHYQSFRRISR